jgi:hypothetical protein
MGFAQLKCILSLLLLFSLTNLFSATYTTTAVVGTWDIGGSPGASDNIIAVSYTHLTLPTN